MGTVVDAQVGVLVGIVVAVASNMVVAGNKFVASSSDIWSMMLQVSPKGPFRR